MKSQPPKKVSLTKKEMTGAVINEMEKGLPELRERLGEKKFRKRMIKAAKLLTKGLSKKAPVTEKPVERKKGKTPVTK